MSLLVGGLSSSSPVETVEAIFKELPTEEIYQTMNSYENETEQKSTALQVSFIHLFIHSLE